MPDALLHDRPLAPEAEDTAKRRQIVDGARAIFLARGFDAASMADIAREAGVSKGTLYVYFRNKEELFAAIVQQECSAHAEGAFDLDPTDPDVEAALTRLGNNFVAFLCTREKASSLRIVAAIADRMPEIGKAFYETGPGYGITRLKAYLDAQVSAGVLKIEDTEIAAAQFLDACQSTLFKPVLFNFAPPPTPQRAARVVDTAVRVFLNTYRKA
ncbi:MAG: TetR/AcrR family transcriptional regulator [Pseudolabrys sp.]|nr:TetR/AcrR family transcriptional regulator [Pseudolabrys sp.]MBV9260960.1 TetR/AcrR family transcriptional regulator [Pseudolabrys sp.]